MRGRFPLVRHKTARGREGNTTMSAESVIEQGELKKVGRRVYLSDVVGTLDLTAHGISLEPFTVMHPHEHLAGCLTSLKRKAADAPKRPSALQRPQVSTASRLAGALPASKAIAHRHADRLRKVVQSVLTKPTTAGSQA